MLFFSREQKSKKENDHWLLINIGAAAQWCCLGHERQTHKDMPKGSWQTLTLTHAFTTLVFHYYGLIQIVSLINIQML